MSKKPRWRNELHYSDECPFCLNNGLDIIGGSVQELYRVVCKKCGALGPGGVSRMEAIRVWNGEFPDSFYDHKNLKKSIKHTPPPEQQKFDYYTELPREGK